MGYWDETDRYINRHGRAPRCPDCGKDMFPQDDHGRFTCFCNIGGGLDVVTGMRLSSAPKIPQVDTAGMSDEEKAQIAPINRLQPQPTTAESRVLSMLLRGPECMNDPEYVAACKDLDEERRNQSS